jgi:hypothetical protein
MLTHRSERVLFKSFSSGNVSKQFSIFTIVSKHLTFSRICQTAIHSLECIPSQDRSFLRTSRLFKIQLVPQLLLPDLEEDAWLSPGRSRRSAWADF